MLYSCLCHASTISSQDPLPSLDEFIQHEPDISKHEPANIKGEKLSGVAGAELESDVRLRGMLEAWVFDLPGDLI